jgi:Zn-dependent protease
MLLLVGFGWAKPVPVNPYALQRRSSAALMWVSLAGPMSNLLMAILAAVLFRLMRFASGSAQVSSFLRYGLSFLLVFISINLLLMLFNLIPIAPLDGEKVAEHLLPPSWSRTLESIRPYGPMILLAVLFVGPMIGMPIISWIVTGPLNAMVGLFTGIH